MKYSVIHRLKVAFKARDIYKLAHKLRARQAALELQMVHEDPEVADPVQLALVAWDQETMAFFDEHPATLDTMAVWMDLDEADRLLSKIQGLYTEGGRLWDRLTE